MSIKELKKVMLLEDFKLQVKLATSVNTGSTLTLPQISLIQLLAFFNFFGLCY